MPLFTWIKHEIRMPNTARSLLETKKKKNPQLD